MSRQLEFAGKSGAVYRYTEAVDGPPMWPSGGNYVFVRDGERRPQLVYAGETESLFRGYREGFDRAQAEHGATAVFVRLNVSGAVRREEQADLVAKHKPPMNPPPPAARPKRTRKSPARRTKKAAET